MQGSFVLKSAGSRLAKGECRFVTAALLSIFLASCSSTVDPTLSVGMPGYNAADLTPASSAAFAGESAAAAEPQQLMSAEGDTDLPDQVAFMPAQKPAKPRTRFRHRLQRWVRRRLRRKRLQPQKRPQWQRQQNRCLTQNRFKQPPSRLHSRLRSSKNPQNFS
jgi:hypothetical protein